MTATPRRYTRRDALRIFGGSALALAATLKLDDAGASRAWCRTDPIIKVNGQLAHIYVSGPVNAPLLVTGPTEVVVSTPVGADAEHIASDNGFGQGYVVTFVESKKLRATDEGVELNIAVLVPATDDTMPVKVEFASRITGILSMDSALGTANRWVSLDTTL